MSDWVRADPFRVCDELFDDCIAPIGEFAGAMNLDCVRMVDVRQNPRFSNETLSRLLIVNQRDFGDAFHL